MQICGDKMPAITATQVKAFINTSLSDASINLLIDMVDEADACLTENSVSDAQATMAKIYGVCALIQEQQGGAITSQSSFTGDSITVSVKKMSSGNQYTSLLSGMSGGACVLSSIGMAVAYPFEIKRA